MGVYCWYFSGPVPGRDITAVKDATKEDTKYSVVVNTPKITPRNISDTGGQGKYR